VRSTNSVTVKRPRTRACCVYNGSTRIRNKRRTQTHANSTLIANEQNLSTKRTNSYFLSRDSTFGLVKRSQRNGENANATLLARRGRTASRGCDEHVCSPLAQQRGFRPSASCLLWAAPIASPRPRWDLRTPLPTPATASATMRSAAGVTLGRSPWIDACRRMFFQ
jgi:hypothetical protein